MSIERVLSAFENQNLYLGESLPLEAYECFKSRIKEIQRKAPGALELVHGGLRTGSHCGVLTAGKWSLEILPKIDRAQNRQSSRGLLLKMLGLCLDLPLWMDQDVDTDLGGGLLEVLVNAFVQEVRHQSTKGLISKYENKTESLAFLKGRLNVQEHIRSSALGTLLIPCTFDELTIDNSYNQTLKHALKISLLVTRPSSVLRQNIHKLLDGLSDVTEISVSASQIASLPLNRLTLRYRQVLKYAEWVVGSLQPDVRHGTSEGISFLFNMNVLFESYVAKVLELNLRQHFSGSGFVLKCQTSGHQLLVPELVGTGTGQWIKPDLQIIQSGVVRAVLDTKWKIFDGKTPSTSDTYQMLAYGYGLGCDCLELIYPATGDNEPLPVNYKLMSKNNERFNLRVRLFDLNNPNQSVQQILAGLAVDEMEDLAYA